MELDIGGIYKWVGHLEIAKAVTFITLWAEG